MSPSFGDLRGDQHAAHRGHGGRLFAEHEARQVEVVDHHVAEQAARHPYVGQWGRRRVAAGDDYLVQGADLAGGHPFAHAAVGGVVAAVEADLDWYAAVAHLLPARCHPLQTEVDRLLAENRLAGLRGGDDQVDVGVGGGGDQHRVDAGGERRVHAVRHRGAVLFRQRRGRARHRVVYAHEARAGAGREVAGMHGADAARAEQGKSDHRHHPTKPDPLRHLRHLGHLGRW